MSFKDELNEIKTKHDDLRSSELENNLKIKNEKHKLDFQSKVEDILSDLDGLKIRLKDVAKNGSNSTEVMKEIAYIKAYEILGTTHVENLADYAAVKATILTTRPNSQSPSGWSPDINENAGKKVLKDEKLILLWKTLEKLELQPFFHKKTVSFGHFKVDLHVRF